MHVQSLEASLLLNELKQVRRGLDVSKPRRIVTKIEASQLSEAWADQSVDQALLLLWWLRDWAGAEFTKSEFFHASLFLLLDNLRCEIGDISFVCILNASRSSDNKRFEMFNVLQELVKYRLADFFVKFAKS